MKKLYVHDPRPYNPEKMQVMRAHGWQGRGGQRFKLIDHHYEIDGIAIHIWRSGAGQYGIKVGGKRDGALTFTIAKQRAARMVRLGT